MSPVPQVNLHFNKPQLLSMLVGAPHERLVAGRGTGKTEGVLAPKSADCYLNTMPRGCGVLLGATYTQIQTRTLPGLRYGWEKLGYKENVHYIIGKQPPPQWVKYWNWKGPFRAPLKFQYFISWFNGAGIHMVSQDRPGSSNGITIDWIIGDEAKLLKHDKLVTELQPANRGLIKDFAGNPYHHGTTYTTDMPVGSAGRWILETEAEMDKNKLQDIWAIQYANHLLQRNRDKRLQEQIKLQVAVLMDELKDLRKGFLFYHEASTLENIDALGADYILEQLRDSSIFQFDTQILNKRPWRSEHSFYPDFNEEQQGYFDEDYGYIDTLGYAQTDITRDSRWDRDVDKDKPLSIALDYNRRIHPLVVGQRYETELRTVKGLHSLYPNKLKSVLDQFARYYKYHREKTVYYWYDHTAVDDMRDEGRMCDEVIDTLTKAGWAVIPCYIGQAPRHSVKYRMWGHLLRCTGKYQVKFKINRENCKYAILSIIQANAMQNKDGFEKDKRTERDPKFPAEESTHYSDAEDTLVYGELECDWARGEYGTGGFTN